MKKPGGKIFFAGILFIAASIQGCRKDDTTAPIVHVNGPNPMTLVLGETYTEYGATATDNADGTVSVTITGAVNTKRMDTYALTYSATDGAGNTSAALRIVYVVLRRQNYLWPHYQAIDSCTTNTSIGIATYMGSVAQGGSPDTVIITNFGNTLENCIAVVNGETISIPNQNVGQLANVSGSGLMNATADTLTINYSATVASITNGFNLRLIKR